MLPLHLSLKCIKIKEIILDMAVVYQIQPCAQAELQGKVTGVSIMEFAEGSLHNEFDKMSTLCKLSWWVCIKSFLRNLHWNTPENNKLAPW